MPAQPVSVLPALHMQMVTTASPWSRIWSPVHAMVNRWMSSESPTSGASTTSAASSSSVPAYLRRPNGQSRVVHAASVHGSDKQMPADTRCALAGLRSFRQAPVRVIRMSEQGICRGQAGRMVISGRMADVCAELDRLAEREAFIH